MSNELNRNPEQKARDQIDAMLCFAWQAGMFSQETILTLV